MNDYERSREVGSKSRYWQLQTFMVGIERKVGEPIFRKNIIKYIWIFPKNSPSFLWISWDLKKEPVLRRFAGGNAQKEVSKQNSWNLLKSGMSEINFDLVLRYETFSLRQNPWYEFLKISRSQDFQAAVHVQFVLDSRSFIGDSPMNSNI